MIFCRRDLQELEVSSYDEQKGLMNEIQNISAAAAESEDELKTKLDDTKEKLIKLSNEVYA